MKILLIGATGLVGSAVKTALLKKGEELVTAGHIELDIAAADFSDRLKEIAPDAIVNTAVFQGVEPCEHDPEKAFMVNVHATRLMAQYCGDNDRTFAYISTEAVFGESNDLRYEKDTPSPMNYYGLTKYDGEIMTRTFCPRHYIFRLPVMFGTRENKAANFLEKMHGLYKNGKKTIKVVDDIYSRPTYNADVAKTVADCMVEGREYGIYHLVNSGEPASSYEFVTEFFRLLGINDMEIGRAKATDFSMNEIGKKPLRTLLGSSRINEMRDWREAMAEYVNIIKERGYV